MKFDITLARFVQGDLILTDVAAAGVYDGKGLSLTKGQAGQEMTGERTVVVACTPRLDRIAELGRS